MAFTTNIWSVDDDRLRELSKSKLDKEERLEQWIATDPGLLGEDVLIIGRQVRTPHGGCIDLLAIDTEGDLTVIELKRDQTPRDIMAQILDYAAWVCDLNYDEITRIAEDYLKQPLATAFAECFDEALPETLNNDHRLLVVASKLDEASERIVQYLADRQSLNINVVFFDFFVDGDRELLARSWLMDPERVEKQAETRKRVPWSGFWYVNVGEGGHRNWDDARNYGFLSAGGNERWQRQLRKLSIGDRVFAYLKGYGYVGCGEVTQEAQEAKAFVPEGQATPLPELTLVEPNLAEMAFRQDGKEEWAVGIRWLKAIPREQAKAFKGIFANQNVVCKLRDTTTIEFLREQFGVED